MIYIDRVRLNRADRIRMRGIGGLNESKQFRVVVQGVCFYGWGMGCHCAVECG